MNRKALQSKPFFGRERELSELSSKLMDGDCSVLTILGIGGVGKTTIALKLAEELQGRFKDGVCFVPLADLEHSGQVAPAIASKLVLERIGGSAAGQLPGILSGKSLLLVLDNFEHLISAATLVEEIGLKAEKVKLLVTSRTRLNIAGEVTYQLSGMSIPVESTPELLFSSPPVKLFLSNPVVDGKIDMDDMKILVQICREVDGVPLAIVLASSWLKSLTPLEILNQIAGEASILNRETAHAERRHSNLRRVFDYSWMLLSRGERLLFSELSIFRGGFDFDAVEYITGRSKDSLFGLWDKSLVQSEPGHRFSLHQLLHSFSSGKLEKQEKRRKVLTVRHADYYCRLLGKNEEVLLSENSSRAMDVISASLSEVRAAVSTVLNLEMSDLFVMCSRSLSSYYLRTGLLEEGREIFSKASEMLQDSSGEGFLRMKMFQSDFAIELALYEEAAFLLDKVLKEGIKELSGNAALSSGMVYLRTGNLERARSRMNSALKIARDSGDKVLEARALGGLGDFFNHKLEPEKANYFVFQAVELNKEQGNIRRLFSNWITLSNTAVNNNQSESALEYAKNASECAAKLKGDLYIALGLVSTAEALEKLGSHKEALEYVTESVKLFEKIDSRWGLQAAYRSKAIIESSLGMEEESIETINRSIHISNSIGGTYNSMESYITGGNIFRRAGRTEEAAVLYTKARKIAGNLKIDKYLKLLDRKLAELEG